MAAEKELGAWLESGKGERWPVGANCAIGRSLSNQVVLPETKVSRRHAIVHCQGEHEYWLVDLGSSNGTYLNGRRVAQPTRLQDQDQIAVGDNVFGFRQQKAAPVQSSLSVSSEATITEIKRVRCWLLLADIIGSTKISQDMPSNELSMMMGRWLATCKELVERNGGAINKFLGDGFFAYWYAHKTSPESLAATLNELRAAQQLAAPSFRVVLHHGEVAVGGAATMGEESLIGSEVNLVFRMEKLAGGLGKARLMSAPAQKLLGTVLETQETGRHEVPGFATPELYYEF